MAERSQSPALAQPVKPLSLIPPGLKEAALDSPTFRASTLHFTDQVDLIEKWLDGYAKSAAKLSHEVTTIEGLVNGFLTQATPPSHVSEAVLDHDYTLLAIKRYGEVAREFWAATISNMKRMEVNMVEPIRTFIQIDLRSFKDIRRQLDQSQKQLDNFQYRYSAQVKLKEPSSLREDAFQLHEARKAYLKASLDFSVAAPHLRMSLDKMIVKLCSDQWRDMRSSRDIMSGSVGKWGSEIERIRGWSREMESGEKTFRKELQSAREQIEENAEAIARPSRELEDYGVALGSTSGSKGLSATNLQPSIRVGSAKSEKQGWLNLRTVTGKPARTLWVRRWFFVKNGIFSWLVQGSRSGGVEESERIGVLLCSVRPSVSEERRFCFEVLTKDTTILLQAETQVELVDWIGAFEVAKQKALEDPASTDSPGIEGQRAQDAAFAILPPSAPEFAANATDSGMQQFSDESSGAALDRNVALPVPERDQGLNIASRSSFDISTRRRSTLVDETGRDHATRIIQKLDLRKPSGGSQTGGNISAGPPSSPAFPTGGIASLISASHTVLPIGSAILPQAATPDLSGIRASPAKTMRSLPSSTLAPSTLANPPAPTNLSTAAVIVSGERGIGLGRNDATGGMPSGIMANLWGSSNWGYLNRLQAGDLKASEDDSPKVSNPPSPRTRPSGSPPKTQRMFSNSSGNIERSPSGSPGRSQSHRKTISLDSDLTSPQKPATYQEFPSHWPLVLKAQDAQFRLLFPNVPWDEKVVLVFLATWNPNDQQEFPGRVYVTAKEIYFYSHHLGLVLISGVTLKSISEVTGAPGRDCDFLFLHLKDRNNKNGFTRITVKTFLEPLRLLQRRLNFLVQNCNSHAPLDLESIMKSLMKFENEDPGKTPSLESWEEVSPHAPVDDSSPSRKEGSQRNERDLRANVLVDRTFYGEASKLGENREVTKFKLPRQPVVYVPSNMDRVAVEKEFEISPKALFHVMFGDKSAVWQLLYSERRAQRIKQGSWNQPGQGHLRREFEYDIEYLDRFWRNRVVTIVDNQMIDVFNDHLCYVVTDRKINWHLPYRQSFILLSKIVITHVAKSKCKLAIYTKVDWTMPPRIAQSMINKRALGDLELDALDLADVITDQVRKLGAQSRTKKAIQIFGQVGLQTEISEFAGGQTSLISRTRRSMKRHTMMGLFLESCGSLLESIATSLMLWSFAFIRWIWKTSNANTILLTILALSIIINFVLSAQETSQWWKERKAGNFMTRLGVGPNLVMSRAVYVQDVYDATAQETDLFDQAGNKCLETFREVISLTDLDEPYQSAKRSVPESSSRAATRHLLRTKQRLGSHRHDLLVALRVINSIEREMMQAEWEAWLLDENAKCKQLEYMLRKNQTDWTDEGQTKTSERVLNGRQERFFEYCNDCRREQDRYLGQ